MLKTILFLSIIIKLTFGEEEDSIDDDLEVSTVEITMNTFDALTPYIEIYNDEIEAEMMKYCMGIKGRRPCMRATSRRAPDGADTGRRGNNSPGECMWFKSKRNKVVQALGNRCLPPAQVIQYRKANRPTMDDEEEEIYEDEDDIDAIEIPEELFDSLSANAPSKDVTEEMMKYCLQIKKETKCMRSVSRKYPTGRNTGRRYNDDHGECMWFKKPQNKVVQALGNRCLPPAQVIAYRQSNRPIVENELFAALGLTNENNELNYSALSMVIVMMVLIGFGAYYKLCKNHNKKDSTLLHGERRPSQYQSV